MSKEREQVPRLKGMVCSGPEEGAYSSHASLSCKWIEVLLQTRLVLSKLALVLNFQCFYIVDQCS